MAENTPEDFIPDSLRDLPPKPLAEIRHQTFRIKSKPGNPLTAEEETVRKKRIKIESERSANIFVAVGCFIAGLWLWSAWPFADWTWCALAFCFAMFMGCVIPEKND